MEMISLSVYGRTEEERITLCNACKRNRLRLPGMSGRIDDDEDLVIGVMSCRVVARRRNSLDDVILTQQSSR